MTAVTIISYHESKESLKEFHSKLESLETHGTPHLAVVCGTVTKDKNKRQEAILSPGTTPQGFAR